MSRIRLVIPGEVDLKRNNSTSKASKVRSRWEGGGVEFSNKHGTFINLFRLVGTLSPPTNYDCLSCVWHCLCWSFQNLVHSGFSIFCSSRLFFVLTVQKCIDSSHWRSPRVVSSPPSLDSSPLGYVSRSSKRRLVSTIESPSTRQESIVTVFLGVTDFDGWSNTTYKNWLLAMQPTVVTYEYDFFVGKARVSSQQHWKILSSLLLGSLNLHLDFNDPSNPIFTGTTGISLYLAEVLSITTIHYPYIIFLYSILIPQHPVPLSSVCPNHPRQSPHHPRVTVRDRFPLNILKIVPSILGNSFFFLSFAWFGVFWVPKSRG